MAVMFEIQMEVIGKKSQRILKIILFTSYNNFYKLNHLITLIK